MIKMDEYRHLDDEPFLNPLVRLSMDELAGKVVECNYGVHRFLSSLVRTIKNRQGGKESPLAARIEAALNEGLYW